MTTETWVYHDITGLDEMIDEVHRVANVAKFRIIGRLTTIHNMMFAETQVLVASPAHPHVPTYMPTGSLFNSGRKSTDFDGYHWEANITYGGPSSPRDVDYAIYEMARGGVHDFFRTLPAYGPQFESAITDVLDDVGHG